MFHVNTICTIFQRFPSIAFVRFNLVPDYYYADLIQLSLLGSHADLIILSDGKHVLHISGFIRI